MILAPLFDLKFLIRPWATPAQELEIGGANRPETGPGSSLLSNVS